MLGNYLPIIAAAVASFIIGMFWYSPAAFGNAWIKSLGWTKKDAKKRMKNAGKSMAWSFIGSLVAAYVLSIFIKLAGANSVYAGAVVGFWIWLGFLATATLGGVLWEGKKMQWYYINASYQLVNIAAMGAILAVWP